MSIQKAPHAGWGHRRPGRAARALTALIAAGLLAGAAAAAEPDCTTERLMQARLSREGMEEQLRSVLVDVDPVKKQAWDQSRQDFGGTTYSGADVYRLLAFQSDRNNIGLLEARMREQGTPQASIDRGIAGLIELSGLMMKDRFLRINAGYQQLFLHAGENSAVLTTQKKETACVLLRLRDLTVQHYALDLPAGWLKKGSKLPALLAAYRKENRFGVAAFARTAEGEGVVLLAKPQFGTGSFDGPVPYYFSGVLLVERTGGAVDKLGDLMHTRYTLHNEYNFEK